MDTTQLLEAGAAAHQAGNLAQAESLYRQVLAVAPLDINALHLLGVVHLQQNRAAEAVDFLQRAVTQNPNLSAVQFNLGLALGADNRPADALAAFDMVVKADPRAAEAWEARGNALAALHRPDDALRAWDTAQQLQPRPAALWATSGHLLLKLQRHEDAREHLLRALEIDPLLHSALQDITACTDEMGRPQDALPQIERALALAPDSHDLHYVRGLILLQDKKRIAEVSDSFEAALLHDPNRTDLLANALRLRQYTCNWVDDDAADRLRSNIMAGESIPPATAYEILFDRAVMLANARAHVARTFPTLPQAKWDGRIYRHDRIRVAYLSADFRNHVVGSAAIELIERHDRKAFEVIGISYGPEDRGVTRPRFIKAFESFHDARGWSDAEVAQWLADREVDIAVDLSGYCEGGRPDVLAYRGAPVQVSYLGFLPTRGASYVDYLLGDAIATPPEMQPYYVEQIAALPDCYLMSDTRQLAVPSPPTREAAGLPAGGIVYCAFNQPRKITSTIFDVWMRILKRVDGSVLWLRCDDAAAQRNLRGRALAAGVDRGRLIFAPEVSLELHIARHHLGDLFLDTPDYNAHTTATDSLRTGLPILTCMGRSVVGRLGASILHAAGFPELVADSLEEYEERAVALGLNPATLRAIRTRLREALPGSKLLNLDKTTREIETAFRTMVETQRAGKAPRPFTVPRQ